MTSIAQTWQRVRRRRPTSAAVEEVPELHVATEAAEAPGVEIGPNDPLVA